MTLSISYVDDYIDLFKQGKLVFNEKRIKLIDWLEKDILSNSDYYFDEQMIDDYISFSEQWYFPLDDWEKFIASFIFLFHKQTHIPMFRIFIIIVARGNGKNGFMSTLAHFLISSLHDIEEYHVSIVANSEKQAKTSFQEIYNKIIRDPALAAINTKDTTFKGKPTGEFEPWKSIISSQETQSEIQYHTSNAETKDGGREGALIFDEFHQYEDSELVKVFTGGLGKKDNPRQFFIGTKGFIRDGYFDMMYERCERILDGDNPHNGIFPFICELDDIKELDDPDMWEKANPALQKPLNNRAERLLQTIKDEYNDLNYEPSGRPSFVTKRMNIIEGDAEHSVASKEELEATRRPLFDLKGLKPIGGLDYGSVRDFASCGLLFKKEDEYSFMQHSYVIKHFVDVHYGYSNKSNTLGGGKKAPIRKWEEQGLLSVIDEPSLDPRHIVDWFIQAREVYGVEKIVADNYKVDILRPLLEKEGFEVETIRRPQSIHPLVAPRIEDAFANKRILFGDDDMMRWYTNNVYVKETSVGKTFLKKEETKRKTDGFQTLVHTMYRANELDAQTNVGGFFDMMDSINF